MTTSKKTAPCGSANEVVLLAAETASDTTELSPHFRFLDLAPELRNKIYHFIFETDERVDLCRAEEIRPEKAITSTCRQVRSETLELHEQATERFWQSLTFTVNVADPYGESTPLIFYACRRLQVASIKTVVVRLEQAKDFILDITVRATGVGVVEVLVEVVEGSVGENHAAEKWGMFFTERLNDGGGGQISRSEGLELVKVVKVAWLCAEYLRYGIPT